MAERGRRSSRRLSVGEQYFYKAQTAPWRPLREGVERLWSAFVNGDLATAENLLPRIINSRIVSETALQPFDKTLLHSACHHGWLEMTWRLIEDYKCDPESRDVIGWTPLHEAAASGHEDVVRYLICEQNRNAACRSDNGDTPLHLACKNGNLGVVNFLIIEENCDPQCTNNDHDTPLHWACKSAPVKIISFLTEQSCNLHCQNSIGDTPLHWACENGNLQVAEFLIKQNCDPQLQNYHGNTSLHLACRSGHLRIVKLLNNFCNVRCQNFNGNTPLHEAYQHKEVIGFLIETNCHEECKDNHGNTILHLACYQGDNEMIKFLLSSGKVNPQPSNREGKAPLHLTVDYETVKTFERFSSFWDDSGFSSIAIFERYCARASFRNTPLHDACIQGDTKIVKFLINRLYCHIDCKNVDGATPLHLACWHGHLDTVEFLIEQNCDPQTQDKVGWSSLHYACSKDRIDVVKFLLSTGKVDPLCQNKEDQTPLQLTSKYNIVKLFIQPTMEEQTRATMIAMLVHYCAKSRSGNTILHDACATGDISIAKCLVSAQYCDVQCKNKYNGTTPLHLACENGHLELVEFLIQKNCDLHCQDNYGDTPLHLACRSSHIEVAKVLTQSGNCDPQVYNVFGETPLHEACRMDRVEVVKFLLSSGRIDPLCTNILGTTALQLTHNYDIVKLFAHLIQCTKKYSLEPATKLFVIGNAFVGKTTLVKVIESKVTSLIAPIGAQWRNVSGVVSHTAGISVVSLQCRRFGNVIIHDLAGQHEYYSSHEAMIQNLISASAALFLVVVNFSDPETEVTRTLQYWLSFVENCCSRVNAVAHVIVIGSHGDVLRASGESDTKKWAKIKSVCISSNRSIYFAGFVAIDCRKLASSGLASLCELIQTSCSGLREMVMQETIACHHVLYAFICTKFQGHTACTVSNLSFQISIEEDALLPTDTRQLNVLLSSLSDSGHVLYLPNKLNMEEGWVVIDKQVLFSKINGTIFAPANFQMHHKIATSTGVVPKSKIADVFLSYDTDMIAGVLTHFEFCQEIKDKVTLSLISSSSRTETLENEQKPEEEGNDSSQPSPNERYYFFPALVQVDRPTHIWQPTFLQYRCAWCLHCSGDGQYFTSRFLHILLLRLAFGFALPTSQQDEVSPVLRRRCAIWKSGIQWMNEDGIETIVDMVEQNKTLLLLLSSLQGMEMTCVKYRSAVMKKILQVKGSFCLNMELEEQLIDPAHLGEYPLPNRSSDVLFSMSDIIRVIKEGRNCVVTKTGLKTVKLDELFYFEPHSWLSGQTQNFLLRADLGQKLETSFLLSMAKDLSRKAEEYLAQQRGLLSLVDKFLRVLRVEATVVCESQNSLTDLYLHRLTTWRDSDPGGGTYGSLRSIIDKYSIFGGREILGMVSSNGSTSLSETRISTPPSSLHLNVDGSLLGIEALLDVRTELMSSIPVWSELGLVLALNQPTLDEIRLRYGNTGQSLTETLAAWLQRRDRVTRPSWQALCTALQIPTLSHHQLAKRIAESHCTGREGPIIAGSLERETLLQDVDDTTLVLGSLTEVKSALLEEGGHFPWFDLGLTLGLFYGTLKRTEVERGGSFEELLGGILVKWLQQNDRVRDRGLPSWRSLVGALVHPLLNQRGLAEQIAEKHIRSTLSSDRSLFQ